LAKDMQKLH